MSHFRANTLARLEWLRDGSQVVMGTQASLLLNINSPELSEEGEYYCRATFTDSNIMPIETSGGFLNLYSKFGRATCVQIIIIGLIKFCAGEV